MKPELGESLVVDGMKCVARGLLSTGADRRLAPGSPFRLKHPVLRIQIRSGGALSRSPIRSRVGIRFNNVIGYRYYDMISCINTGFLRRK